MAVADRKRMTREEALEILEIAEWASRDEIEAAYAVSSSAFRAKERACRESTACSLKRSGSW